MKKDIFKMIGKIAADVVQEINDNDGYMNCGGKMMCIFDPSYEIDENRIASNKLEPEKTGVIHLFQVHFNDFSTLPEFPNLMRLDLRECEVDSFKGLRVNPKLNQLDTRKCKIHSLKGLNVHQILSLLCEYEYDPDFEKLIENLNEDERDAIRDARKKLFVYPEKLIGHEIYGFFGNFDNRYNILCSIDGNEEFSALRKFKEEA